jgi:hypothetical protein
LLAGCGEPAVEGDVEGVRGGLAVQGPVGLSLAGGVEGHGRHMDALQGGGLVGEGASGLDRPPDTGVHGLDRVGRADDAAGLGVEPQERGELLPRVLPEPGDRRMLPSPGVGEFGEPFERGLLGRGGVDGPEGLGDRVPVLAGGIAEGVSRQVDPSKNNALLPGNCVVDVVCAYPTRSASNSPSASRSCYRT